jgi:hypothetical protein
LIRVSLGKLKTLEFEIFSLLLRFQQDCSRAIPRVNNRKPLGKDIAAETLIFMVGQLERVMTISKPRFLTKEPRAWLISGQRRNEHEN